jgi:hypothetical protein
MTGAVHWSDLDRTVNDDTRRRPGRRLRSRMPGDSVSGTYPCVARLLTPPPGQSLLPRLSIVLAGKHRVDVGKRADAACSTPMAIGNLSREKHGDDPIAVV